ncbi:MAG: TetR/AcrR family transcriptional regulator [Alphaproteobacteria bacterium]|nr:TetR/AcrR family transcriptional regulator [Alphaproteobacteria bacterium]
MARTPKARQAKPPSDLLDAALALIAEKGWTPFRLHELAKAAGVSAAEVYRVFPERSAVLAACLERLFTRMLEAEPVAEEGAVRDRVFDGAMQLFDAALPERDAIRVIVREASREPLSVLALRPQASRIASFILEQAGVSAEGFAGLFRVAGLIGILAQTLQVWIDDGDDQARTMAALDKGLRRAEGLMLRLRRTPAVPDQPAPEESDTVH